MCQILNVWCWRIGCRLSTPPLIAAAAFIDDCRRHDVLWILFMIFSWYFLDWGYRIQQKLQSAFLFSTMNNLYNLNLVNWTVSRFHCARPYTVPTHTSFFIPRSTHRCLRTSYWFIGREWLGPKNAQRGKLMRAAHVSRTLPIIRTKEVLCM